MVDLDPSQDNGQGGQDGDGQPAIPDLDRKSPDKGSQKRTVKRSAKKSKKTGSKTEKRFQRLESMMHQLLHQQTGGFTLAPRSTGNPTPASLENWLPDPNPTAYGLPRPVIPRPPNTARPTHPAMSLAAQLARRPDAPPPAPEALIEDPVAADHIAQVIKQLEPAFKNTGGKPVKTYKPHMFIPRRYVNKKMVDKEDVSFPLYVNGMAGMILNALPDHGTVAAALCRHLRETAEDTVVRPWAVAREWSKAIFDRIERGEIDRSFINEIQRERMQVALTWVPPEKKLYPCALYNAKACPEPDSHTEDGITYHHVCAYCHYASAVVKPHPAKLCTFKKAPQQFSSTSVPPNPKSARPRLPEQPPKN